MKHNLSDEKNLEKLGIYSLGVIALSITLLITFWEGNAPEGLSCMGVRSNINNLIDEAQSYKGKGITNTKKNAILAKLEKSLDNNQRLSCKYNERAILKKFNHFSRD